MSLIPPDGIIAEWCDLYTPLGEAPAEAHLASAIATISAAIGWRAYIQWGESREPCTLNVILQGQSATARKTTVANTAMGVIRAAYADGTPPEQQRLRSRPVGHTSDRGLLELVAPPDQETAQKWEDEPPPGIVIFWDEFGAVLGRPGDTKGADWLGRVRTTLMQMANGRHGGIQTGQAKLPASRCAVSVLGTMTRVELEDRVSTGLLRDGFMGRFILVPSPGRREWLAVPPPFTELHRMRRKRIATWLRRLVDTDEEYGSIFDRFTDDALAERRRWYETTGQALERRAESTTSDVDIAMLEAFGRAQTAAAKVAAVYAIAEWEPGACRLADCVIEKRHVEYGQRFAMHVLKELQGVASNGGKCDEDEYLDRVVKYLERQDDGASRKVVLDNVKMRGIDRRTAWRIIADAHPDVVVISVEDTGGRQAHRVRVAS